MKKLKLTINGEVNTFDLPENGEYKCEIEESYVPKVGDCVKFEFDKNFFYWFKVEEEPNYSVDFSLAVGDDLTIEKDGFFSIDNTRIYTQITPEELKAKYAEAGYDWDYESDTIKPLKWVPKDGEGVWWANSIFEPVKIAFDKNNNTLQLMQEKGFLFKTKEESQKFADYCLNYLKK